MNYFRNVVDIHFAFHMFITVGYVLNHNEFRFSVKNTYNVTEG